MTLDIQPMRGATTAFGIVWPVVKGVDCDPAYMAGRLRPRLAYASWFSSYLFTG
jgi:hypothetical protein